MRPESITKWILTENRIDFFEELLIVIFLNYENEGFENFVEYLADNHFGKVKFYFAAVTDERLSDLVCHQERNHLVLTLWAF